MTDTAELSLIPCRKVSIVVRVQIPSMRSRLCLFPLLPETPSNGGLISPAAATLNAASALETGDIVVVNPTAFGKFIPAEVTMDTARLVANVVRGLLYPTVLRIVECSYFDSYVLYNRSFYSFILTLCVAGQY